MSRMSTIVLATAAVTLLMLGLPGIRHACAQHEVPFVGVVLEDRTPLRAGAGQPFYVVGQLNSNDQVMVREVIVGWMRVDAPAGTFSYLSRLHADLAPDGRTAVVNTDRAPVMAASPQGPAPSYQIQRHLDKGTRLEVVATEGNFLKVVPPAGATLFLAPGSVRRATAQDLAAQEQAPPAPTPDAPAVEPDPEPEPVEIVEPQVPSTPEPEQAREPERDDAIEIIATETIVLEEEDQVVVEQEVVVVEDDAQQVTQEIEEQEIVLAEMEKEAEMPRVDAGSPAQQLDARMRPLFLQPVETQPFDEMEAQYRALLEEPELSSQDRRLINLRLAAIDRNRQLAEVLRSLTDAQQQVLTASEDAVAAQQVRERQVTEARERQRRTFDLRGQLLASSVFDGQNTPRMLRLVDPSTGRTMGYLLPEDSSRASHLLGEQVGIVGTLTFDASMGLNVVQVSAIERIER